MNGVRRRRAPVEQRSDSRKLFSITESPSVAVVAEIAPICITASSLRPSSQRTDRSGGTNSASWRFRRLRHLPVVPSQSLTAMSGRPASLRLATTFDPMKPAPPVTNSIDWPECPPSSLCPTPPGGATKRPGSRKHVPRQCPGVLGSSKPER